MLGLGIGSALRRLASGVDRGLHAVALARSSRSRRRSRAESLGHDERMSALEGIARLYEAPEHFSDPDTFFVPPAPVAPRIDRAGRLGGDGEVLDAVWDSGYSPFCDRVAARWQAHEANRTAVARLLSHRDRARPAIVLLHGYLGGSFAVERRCWPVRRWFDAGADVVLGVLPFHGARRTLGRRPLFPSSDPRFTVEGFRQAVHDLRALLGWLRRRGAPGVGVMGMSLGGYTAALLATVEPSLAFAVALVPFVSIAEFAREGGRLVGSAEQQRAQFEALEGAHRVVSPLARAARIPADRIVVVAGESDRITPAPHARRLAEHLGARFETFPGGHILQIGRAAAFAPVQDLVQQLVARG
jgi:pimeloyl-ACP methyl ester carboxylesterase